MKRKFVAVMMLCFLLGGYFIFSFISQIYALAIRGALDNFREDGNISNLSNGNNQTSGFFREPRAPYPLSPFILTDLIGGIVLIIAGWSIWYIGKEKEMKVIREDVTNMLLLPEEKMVIDELKKAGGEITQKELVRKTGLSKVKIHRILNKLESKKLIKRYPYGTTKKIILL
jgi:uncharacterized membrane protein